MASPTETSGQAPEGSQDARPIPSFSPGSPQATGKPRRGLFRRFLRWFGIGTLALLLFLLTLWGMAALYFDVSIKGLNILFACCYVLGVIGIWITVKRRFSASALTVACFAAVLTWWLLLPPSNNRNWQKDVTVLPYADIEGNRITVHSIRNCDYRTETDFDVRHYDKTFDLGKLRTIDLYLVYW